MPKRITEAQKQAVLRMLAQGVDRETIAASVAITPGQVSAVAAHVRMGTYTLPAVEESREDTAKEKSRTKNMLHQMHKLGSPPSPSGRLAPILLGIDAESNEEVFWNPDPESGAPNPHVLVLGESGFGKTYTIACLLAELAQRRLLSVVLDYGQGFALDTLPPEFLKAANPVELFASRDGLDINPLQIFPSDLHGPVNVAQRVADTFARVYPRIGVQQHAVLRQAVLDVMADEGIVADDIASWGRDLPVFRNVERKLLSYANNPNNPQSRFAASVASHISTLFVFNTFRSNGQKLAWAEMLEAKDRVFLIQLKGLDIARTGSHRVSPLESYRIYRGPRTVSPPLFIVLDEAHKLSFDQGSPVEKLLREGRKFGLGLILASQQPEDFSPVAFANTATKIVFQVGDEKSIISGNFTEKSEIHIPLEISFNRSPSCRAVGRMS